jgi:hypothetical protein
MNVPSRAPRLALFGPPRESVLGRRGRTRRAGGAEGRCVGRWTRLQVGLDLMFTRLCERCPLSNPLDTLTRGRFSSHLQRPFTPSMRHPRLRGASGPNDCTRP